MCYRKIHLLLILIGCYFFYSSIFAYQCENTAIQIIESTSNSMVIQLKVDSIKIHDVKLNQNIYQLLSIPGFDFTSEVGRPQLPMKGLSVAVPPTGKVRLQISDSQIENRSSFAILPVLEPQPDERKQGEAANIYDYNILRDIWYPEEVVTINDTGFIRDQRVVFVQICPIQFNPARQSVKIFRSLIFALNFENDVNSRPNKMTTKVPQFENTLKNLLLNYEAGKGWRKPKSNSPLLLKTDSRVLNSVKIYVNEDGIYRINKNDLEKAGMSVSGIDPRTIKIFKSGQQLSIFVAGERDGIFDNDDYIQFQGQFHRGENSFLSPFSSYNVYWLTWGGERGFRMVQVEGGLYQKDTTKLICSTKYQFTQHFEEDLHFDRLLLVTDESRDHWFWKTINAHQVFEIQFTLSDPLAIETNAEVKVVLYGATHPTVSPDHHTVVRINGHLIEDITWDGQNEHFIEVNIPNHILKDGENVLSVFMPGDTPAGEVDQVFMNWFEIRYWRPFQTVNDFIEFQVDPSQLWHQFEVNGFSNERIHIIDNLGRYLVNFETIKKENTYSVIFQDIPNTAMKTYYIFTDKAIKNPEKIIADISSGLKSPQNGADYIIITHELFQNAVQTLADHRSGQGLRVKVANIQDIYDEFSYGIFDPRAINHFLKYAYQNWMLPAPLYVLLVGDATYANDKQVARNWGKTCYIPTLMKYTNSWGLTSSDNAFVCISGNDRLPDMFIGRLPVNSIEEAIAVIDKIIRYEEQPTFGDWRKRVCLACGNGTFFEQSADLLYNEYIPRAFDVPRIYTNPKSKYFGSTDEMVHVFNNGVALLNFIGHGGGGVFFDDELFLLEDMIRLNNSAMLPILFSLTCFIGYFDNPWTPSLGEELLRANNKGVVATFGSAGRAWIYGDYFLNNALFQSLFINRNRILGQIITEAKWQMMAWSSSYWDHVENYNLLGDPALKIGFPEQEISIKIDTPLLKPGDTLIISGTVPLTASGLVKLTVFDSDDSLITKESCSFANGQFKVGIQLPQAIKKGQGIVKAYFWNDDEDGFGTGMFGIETPCFSTIFTEPLQPGHLDSTYILTRLEASSQIGVRIDSVFCSWSLDQISWQNIPMPIYSINTYKTQHPIIAAEGCKIYYNISALYSSENNYNTTSIESHLFSYTIRKRADLLIIPPGPMIGGREQAIIQIPLKNDGETDARKFSVVAFDGNPSAGIQIGDKVILNLLKAKSDTILYLAWTGDPKGCHELFIRADAENKIDEFNEYNNLLSTEISLLTVKNGSAGAVASEDSNFWVTVPPNAITCNTSFDIDLKTREEISGSFPIPESFFLATLADGSQGFYLIDIANKESRLVKSFSIAFHFSREILTSILGLQLKIYSWDEQTGQWIYRAGNYDSSHNKIQAQAGQNDFLLGLFDVNDAIPPKIFIKVENQVFTDGDYVSSQPHISAILEDESGIDLQIQPPVITLNEQVVNAQEILYSQSPTSKHTVMLIFSPNLSSGDYKLNIKATDAAGNPGNAVINLKVSADFELQAIANHPNPFREETTIAYTLTDEAREVKIKIYTSSGRLIKSFNFTHEVGYVEHVWDGRDELSDEVANGVYYMQFEAQKGSKRITRIEKMAKIR